MSNIILISTIGVSVIAIIYALTLSRLVSGKPAGSKKMADVAKLLLDEAEAKYLKNLKDLALVSIVLFTGLLYAFGWAMALCFLAAAIIFAATDYFSLIISDKADIRMAEAARIGIDEAFSLGFNAAIAGSLITFAPMLMVITAVFFFAGGNLMLWSLALAAIVTAIFSRQKNSGGFPAVFAAALVATLVLAGSYFPEAKNAQVFSLAIFALGLIATITGSWLAKIGSRAASIFIIKNQIIALVVFLAGSYFIARYLLPSSGKYGILIWFLLLAAAAIFAFGSLLFGRKLIILPAIMLAALALVANFFVGNGAIALFASSIAAMIPLAATFYYFFTIARKAEIISQSAELPEEAGKNLAAISLARISTKNQAALSGAVVVLAIILFFVDKFAVGQFGLANLKLFAGLCAGGALAYYFSSEVFSDEITPLAISIILPILAGLVFGPTMLAGALAGMILTNLLVKNINREVLTFAVVSILIVQFTTSLYSVRIRLIILGAAVVVIALCLIIKKLYDNRKANNGR